MEDAKELLKRYEAATNDVYRRLAACRGLLRVAEDAGDLDEVIGLLGEAMAPLEGLVEDCNE